MMNKPLKTSSKGQWLAIVLIIVVGAVLAFLILTQTDKKVARQSDDDDGPRPAQTQSTTQSTTTAQGAPKADGETPRVSMDDHQIEASGIVVATAGTAPIASVLQFPGEVQLNDDRTVHVVPRVSGIVESVMVSTGQFVRKGQTLAVFSSQSISEQRSALQTALKRETLAQIVYEREKKLWEQKITAEQDFLQAQTALREAEIAVENAQQKLNALGVAAGSGAGLNRFDLRAPLDGLVVERKLSVGEAVRDDTHILTISDMSSVWVEVSIPAKDLPLMRVGGKVLVRATAFEAQATGTVAFVGALVGEQTRMARARIVLANPQGAWRPGLFVNVEVNAANLQVPVAIQSEAIQTLGSRQVVFVREDKGFTARGVKLGITDGKHVEVLEGLPPGTRYAARGSYILKSELTKLTSEEGY
jgi:cobalt-zinc-cadmium efflux system membrane fusion protein